MSQSEEPDDDIVEEEPAPLPFFDIVGEHNTVTVRAGWETPDGPDLHVHGHAPAHRAGELINTAFAWYLDTLDQLYAQVPTDNDNDETVEEAE